MFIPIIPHAPHPTFGKLLLRLYLLHCNRPITLGKFVIREWGSDRGNMWHAGREVNRGVEDGDKSVFKKVRW